MKKKLLYIFIIVLIIIVLGMFYFILYYHMMNNKINERFGDFHCSSHGYHDRDVLDLDDNNSCFVCHKEIDWGDYFCEKHARLFQRCKDCGGQVKVYIDPAIINGN